MVIDDQQLLPGRNGEDELPVIDCQIIDELRSVGGSDELLQRVLTLFAIHVPKSMALAKKLAAAGEIGELADAVHALKSMCGNIGARRAAAICEEIEHLAREGCPFDPVSKTLALSKEVDAVLSETEKLKTR